MVLLRALCTAIEVSVDVREDGGAEDREQHLPAGGGRSEPSESDLSESEPAESELGKSEQDGSRERL